MQNINFQEILNGLMDRYKNRVPDVQKILKSMLDNGVINSDSEIENDHIAFRTLGVPNLGIASLEKIFLHYGYTKRDYYFFEGKKLNAYWYSPPLDIFPRIFISELRVNDLSERARNIIKKYSDIVTQDPVDSIDLNNSAAVDAFLHSSLWELPRLDDYLTLSEESEYAAWTIYNRYYLNHYTISVHNLKSGYDTIEDFNGFLEKIGIKLNNSGGVIKKSPDGLLLQSSTVAQMIEAEFQNGLTHRISGSYVEFAERKPYVQFAYLPKAEIKREHRRDGFEAQNADKIFESTYSTQTDRMQM